MSLGSWDPDAAQSATEIAIDQEQLKLFIAWSAQDQLEQLETLLGDNTQQLSGLMQLDHATWTTASADHSNDELLHLIRFFTVVENEPGWEAGEHSPVIPLAKALRQRGQRLDRDFLLWMRSLNSNRYLPYGPLI
jgi:hypothetical protein